MLNLREKIEIIEISRAHSIRETADIFNRRHPDRYPISHTTVSRIQAKLRTDGSLERKTRAQNGAFMDGLENQVLAEFEQNPHESTRRIGARLGVSIFVSIWRSLKKYEFSSIQDGCASKTP